VERTLTELALYLDAELRGNKDRVITGCAELNNADINQLSFIYDKKYRPALIQTKAGVVILTSSYLDECPVDALIVENPYLAYAKAASLLSESQEGPVGIHPSVYIGENSSIPASCTVKANAVIADNVVLGENCTVGYSSVIESGCRIGADTVIMSKVTICHDVVIGRRVLIHPGAVIGGDGFGFARDGEHWVKIPQIGTVILGDDADVGANTTIDRGALGDTVVGNGVKIDNQVQIAHNVVIGNNTAIAACTGIAGSTKIGQNCTFAGGVGVVGHLTLVDGVHITGMTMVTNSISEPGVYSSGTPFQKNSDWLKNAVRFKQLNKLFRTINKK